MSLTRNKMMVTGGGDAVVGCPITYPIDNSLLISGESSAANTGYLSRSLSQSGDRKTWTYSTWIKRDNEQASITQYIMSAGSNTQNYETLIFYPRSTYSDRPNASFHYQYYTSNSLQAYAQSEMSFRDYSAWYHIVFVKDSTLATAADRLRLYVNGVRQDFINYSSTAFQTVSQNNEGYINNSSYDHYVGSTVYSTTSSDGVGYLAETNFVDGQGLTADDFGVIDTCSGQWVAKEYTGTYGTNGFHLPFSNGSDWSYHFDGNGDWITVPSTSGNPFDFGTGNFTIEGWFYTQRSGSYSGYWGISQGGGANQKINLSDTSGNGILDLDIGGTIVINSSTVDTLDKWVHVAVVREGTGTNQLKIYANGTLVGSGTSSVDFSSFTANFVLGHNGEYWPNAASAFDGYISNFRVVKGTAVYTSSFTPSGSPLTAISGTTYLTAQSSTFVDNSSLGQTVTVNGNTYADKNSPFQLDFADDHSGNANNFTPTNLTGADVRPDTPTNNFCTLNPLGISDYNLWTFTKGNTKGVSASDGFGEATFLLSSGKWYFEVDHTDAGGKNGLIVALVDPNDKWVGGSFDVRLMDGLGTGLYGISIDMDAGSFATTLNGSASSSGSFTPQDCKLTFTNGNTANSKTFIANFGQDSSFAGGRTAQGNADANGIGDFYYTPPSGYLALCTRNLPEPEINNPAEHFNTVLYTGNATTNAVTGVGFQPDFVWIKDRDHVQNHALFDVARGVNIQLRSNLPNAELSFSDLLTSFDTDGFTLGADANVGDINNYSGGKYVSWNWKAGGTAVSNTEGTITSSVSANPTAGFSIVTYTGNGQLSQTVGHGLSQAPEMYIIKRRDGSDVWPIWNHDYPTNNYQILDGTNGLNNGTGLLWSTQPTSTVFGIDNDNSVNHSSSATYLAYCFHSVAGYSKVGIYDGINSQDGTFVPTGFKPAFIFIKRITAGGSNSYIIDNKRVGYNQFIYLTDVGANKYLWPDAATAESAGNSTKSAGMDILSNGFKFRTTSSDYNTSGNSYIYLAIAESPFKYSNAR